MNINTINDVNIDKPVLRMLEEARSLIASQLCEFTILNPTTGMFEYVPEYPEFAWLEGIVNAVTHRIRNVWKIYQSSYVSLIS